MFVRSNAARRLLLTLALALLVGGSAGSLSSRTVAQPSAAEELARVPATVAELDELISERVSRIERVEAERARADAEASSLQERRGETNRRLRARTRSLYRLTRAGALPVTGGLHALLGHLGRKARLERIVRADLAAMSELRARANALREESSARGEELDALRGSLATLQARRTTLEQEALANVWSGSALAPYLGDASSAPLAAPLDVPLGALAAPGTIQSSGFGIRVVGEDAPARASFESQRGRLMIPLLAPTSMREAEREEGAGLEIAGALGASVHAAAEGRVVFAQSHASYGRLVIVDHQDSYFSVYGGLGRIDVAVGQRVSRGSPLGTLDAAPVFFQIRRGTRALEARGWLGL